MAMSKKWYWIHGSATVVLALLIGLVFVEEMQKSNLENKNSDLSSGLSAANVKVNSLNSDVRAYADTLKNQRNKFDSLQRVVNAKNDSIIDLKTALEECHKPKKKKVTGTRNVQTTSVRTQQQSSNVTRIVDTCDKVRPNVRLNSSTNTGNIVINSASSGASVVLESSSSNSGNIVIGNNNTVNVYNAQQGGNVSVNDTVARHSNDSIVCTVKWVQTTARVR